MLFYDQNKNENYPRPEMSQYAKYNEIYNNINNTTRNQYLYVLGKVYNIIVNNSITIIKHSFTMNDLL